MNEPIVSPLVFYVASFVDAIKFGAGFMAMLFGIASTIGLFIWVNEYPTDKEKKGIMCIWKMTVATFLIACFVPSSATIYKMVVAKQITPANIQMVGDKVDKSVDKIIEKIINYQTKLEEKK